MRWLVRRFPCRHRPGVRRSWSSSGVRVNERRGQSSHGVAKVRQVGHLVGDVFQVAGSTEGSPRVSWTTAVFTYSSTTPRWTSGSRPSRSRRTMSMLRLCRRTWAPSTSRVCMWSSIIGSFRVAAPNRQPRIPDGCGHADDFGTVAFGQHLRHDVATLVAESVLGIVRLRTAAHVALEHHAGHALDHCGRLGVVFGPGFEAPLAMAASTCSAITSTSESRILRPGGRNPTLPLSAVGHCHWFSIPGCPGYFSKCLPVAGSAPGWAGSAPYAVVILGWRVAQCAQTTRSGHAWHTSLGRGRHTTAFGEPQGRVLSPAGGKWHGRKFVSDGAIMALRRPAQGLLWPTYLNCSGVSTTATRHLRSRTMVAAKVAPARSRWISAAMGFSRTAPARRPPRPPARPCRASHQGRRRRPVGRRWHFRRTANPSSSARTAAASKPAASPLRSERTGHGSVGPSSTRVRHEVAPT